MMKSVGGFTLIELIMSMIIIGILAVTVLPRLDISGYHSFEFHEKVVAALRYSQKTATSHRRTVCVTVPNNYTLVLNIDTNKDDVCDTALAIPGISNNQIVSNDSVNAVFNPAPAPFNFLSDGTTTDQTLKIVGADDIIVQGTTGYVH